MQIKPHQVDTRTCEVAVVVLGSKMIYTSNPRTSFSYTALSTSTCVQIVIFFCTFFSLLTPFTIDAGWKIRISDKFSIHGCTFKQVRRFYIYFMAVKSTGGGLVFAYVIKSIKRVGEISIYKFALILCSRDSSQYFSSDFQVPIYTNVL